MSKTKCDGQTVTNVKVAAKKQTQKLLITTAISDFDVLKEEPLLFQEPHV